MEPVLYVIGGVLLGVAAGGFIFSRRTAKLAVHVEKVQRELNRIRDESTQQVQRLRTIAAESKQEVESLRQGAQSADALTAQHRKQVAQLEQSLQDLRLARERSSEQASTHQAARAEVERKLAQIEQALSAESKVVQELNTEATRLRREAQQLQEVADRRSEEIRRLHNEKGALGNADDDVSEVFLGQSSLNQILGILMDREGQDAAVLADANGIVVASAGNTKLRDGIAAAAQLVSAMSNQFQDVIPFGSIQSFCVADFDAKVIAGRTFASNGETVALATYGARAPNEKLLEGASKVLHEVLA